MKTRFLFLCVLGVSFLAFGQVVPPAPAPSPGLFDGLVSVLTMVKDVLLTHPYVSIGVTIVAEVFGRLIKTEKPLGVIAGFGRVLGALGGLFLVLDGLISKVVPQRLK